MNKNSKNDRITIIGAGYVGLCTGALLTEMGFPVTFIDVNRERIDTISKGKSPVFEPGLDEIIYEGVKNGSINVTTDYENISNSKTFIISVNTPIDSQYRVNLDYLISASKSLSKVVKDDSLIISRSTVPPLTLREKIIPVFQNEGFNITRDLHFAVMPERLAEGHALKDMRENPTIIGVNDDLTFTRVENIWKELGTEILKISWEEAELTKLTDNLWIDLNIALANEIAIVSEHVKADVRNVIRAANTLKKGSGYVNILTPGIGVGGSCLPKDPHILSSFAETMGVNLKLPSAGRFVNDQMPEHMHELIMKNLKGKDSKKVLLLGLSFNANSGDMRYSPSIYLNEYLQSSGCDVYGYDPLVDPKDLTVLKNLKLLHDSNELFNILPDIDLIAVVAGHSAFRELEGKLLKYMDNKVIIDGRYFFHKEDVETMNIKYVAIGVGNQ